MRFVGVPLGIGLVLVLLVPGLAQASTGSALPAATAPGVTYTTSAWAGYYTYGGHLHSVSRVEGSWIVPHLNASCKHHPTSSIFVGIGMDYVSPYSSQEQMGTLATCTTGTGVRNYQADIFDNGVVKVGVLKIAPGNIISASIVFSSGRLNYSITNHNTSRTFWYHAAKSHSSLANRATAEWFATVLGAAPYNAPFGKLEFGPKFTHLNGTDVATISGHNHAIGGQNHLYRTDMVRYSTSLTHTSYLALDKASFWVGWLAY